MSPDQHGIFTRVYLAASFDRHEEIDRYAKRLQRMGTVEVVSQWHDPEANVNAGGKALADMTDSERQLCAEHDLADLERATSLVLFTPGSTSGGCHVEFGWALARNLRVIVVGPRTNVFHSLPEVRHAAAFEHLVLDWKGEFV